MKHHDDIFPYWGFGSRQGICRIRIYQTRLHTVVVASELRQNRGATVTSFIDGLATKVAQQYDLPTDRLVVIEHRPGLDAFLPASDEYSLVQLDYHGTLGIFSNPRWRALSRSEVEVLIEEAIHERHFN